MAKREPFESWLSRKQAKDEAEPAYIIVEHRFYGCDTGCCGHSWVLCDANGYEIEEHFKFDHPYGVKSHEKEKISQFAKDGVPSEWKGYPINLEGSQITDNC